MVVMAFITSTLTLHNMGLQKKLFFYVCLNSYNGWSIIWTGSWLLKTLGFFSSTYGSWIF